MQETPVVDLLREAAKRAVDAAPLREVAQQVGMGGDEALHDFLSVSPEPTQTQNEEGAPG